MLLVASHAWSHAKYLCHAIKFNSTNELFPCISLMGVHFNWFLFHLLRRNMCFLITSFHLFKGNLVIFPLILAIFIFWLSQPFPSIFAYLALGLYLAVWRVPLPEDSTSYQYVVCLLQKYCIKRFTDWLIVLFRVAVVAMLSIFYFWFAKAGGGGRGCKNITLFF